MVQQRHRQIEALLSEQRAERLGAMAALTLARAADEVHGDAVLDAAERLLASYPLRDRDERAAVARFLETWFLEERSLPLARALAAARMEEVDPAARESLLAASFQVMPTFEVARCLAAPEEEHRLGGLGLLMMLETLAYRLRSRDVRAADLPRLHGTLRAARSIRGSHIARPFLWRLEEVLSLVEEVAARYRA